MKKRRSLLVVLLLISLVFPSCSRSALWKPREEELPTPVVLSLMLPQTHYKDFFEEIIAQFEVEHPEIVMDLLIIPDNQWIDVVKTKVAIGETPDLIRIDKSLIIDVNPKHFVEFDSSEPWYARVLPEHLNSKLIENHLYGLPVGSSTSFGIVYNKKIFEELQLEIPKTMEELRAVCDQLLQAGYIPLYATDKDSWTTQLGISAGAPQIIPIEVWDAVKAGTTKWQEIPELAQLLEDLARLRWDGYTNPDYLQAAYPSAVSAFAQEKTAMYITGRFFVTDVLKENPTAQLMMMPMPCDGDYLTVINAPGQISIFKDTQHLEEAKLFLDWFSQPQRMDIFCTGWNYSPVFVDQEMKIREFQLVLERQFIAKGKTIRELNDIFEGIDMNDFWSYQQEMIARTLNAQSVLELWDASYEQQMLEKAMEK